MSNGNGQTAQEVLKQKTKVELLSGEYRTNHVLHLILSILTGGFWILVWVLVAWRNDARRVEAEKLLYGYGKPNYLVRTLAILSIVVTILAVIGFTMAVKRTVNVESNQTQTVEQIINNY
jgi:hypothetical protein